MRSSAADRRAMGSARRLTGSRTAQQPYGQPNQEKGGYRAERDYAPTIQRPDPLGRFHAAMDAEDDPRNKRHVDGGHSQQSRKKRQGDAASIHGSIVSARRLTRRNSRDSAASPPAIRSHLPMSWHAPRRSPVGAPGSRTGPSVAAPASPAPAAPVLQSGWKGQC